jgi:hypothetical protein
MLIAAILTVIGGTTFAESPAEDDGWQFRLTPYVWLAGITGDTASDGVELPPIEPGYQFFTLENFDGVAFLAFTAQKNQWAIHNDLIFISFADTFPDGQVQASFDLDGGAFELSASYRPESWRNTQLVFGARAVKVSLDATFTPGPSGSDSMSFVDPILGVRHQQTFDNKWGVLARGDVGAGSSELMVNAMLAGSYQFTDVFTLLFGYRYLKIDFEENDSLLDISFQGYSFGFQFDW